MGYTVNVHLHVLSLSTGRSHQTLTPLAAPILSDTGAEYFLAPVDTRDTTWVFEGEFRRISARVIVDHLLEVLSFDSYLQAVLTVNDREELCQSITISRGVATIVTMSWEEPSQVTTRQLTPARV